MVWAYVRETLPSQVVDQGGPTGLQKLGEWPGAGLKGEGRLDPVANGAGQGGQAVG